MPRSFFNTHRLAATALGLLVAGAAFGADSQTPPTNKFDDSWRFSVGAVALTTPRYPGADKERTRLLPLGSATYNRFSFGTIPETGVPVGASVMLVQNDHWHVGTAIGTDWGKQRRESDSPRLKGLGDIKSTVLGSIFARYDDNWFTVRGNVVTDLNERRNGVREFYEPESRRDNSEGTRASLDLEAHYSPLPNLLLSAGPGITWADSGYQRTFFGIDGDQSARSGLPQFSARAGLNAIRLSAGADYRLARDWDVGAHVIASDLRGDAADSPVTEKRKQFTGVVATTFRF